MIERIRVALVDDDAAILDSVQIYIRRRGFTVTCFRGAKALLADLAAGSDFDCVVSDIRMPGMSGQTLHQALVAHGLSIPIIFITGHGDINMAVAAMKSGAFDFIEKPIDERRLVSSIAEAVRRRKENISEQEELSELRSKYSGLSDRQRQVLDYAVQGFSNKEIAVRLEVSPRTVEHYRESAMTRMQADCLADLVRMAVKLKAGQRTA
jgi:two-component system, LuxR family, response regulator FixJ